MTVSFHARAAGKRQAVIEHAIRALIASKPGTSILFAHFDPAKQFVITKGVRP
jgi:hypothetical protein